ncbi:glutaredoxin family protein [Candidatus Formimonas warabiya]|uniref:NrdH-redoxin n=1 Tax=Formimonas warabiya TaxID=1761012 RepID=A0A3G1KRV5_FORW1|nr:glutaredoxin family protein [Candidatus Formimonas warabiya]ATW25199.1 NrdH-redoxin [Candidatus Formimonas warabiya]
MVKVYALSTCPWCKKVKQFLRDERIDFEVVDVDLIAGKEQEQALEEVDKLTGKRSFPITVVNNLVIQGFKPEEIKEALKSEG